MDFSSADVPISRETWAPRSPDRSSSSAPVGSMPPTAPSDARAPQHPTNNDSDYDRSGRSPRAVSRDYDDRRGREDRYSNGNGSGHAPYVPPYRQNDDRERPRDSAEPRRAAPTTAEANPVIGVFGLSVRTKERDLEDEFGKYGDVEKVVIVYDQRTDRSRGFGFITMRKTEHAAEAIKHLNGYNLHGRNIRVDYSATPKAHNPTPGQYMGEKKPIYGVDDRYRGRYGGDNRRFDDRRGYDRGDRYDRYDDRRDRDRDAYRPPRDYSDPYGGRSRREDDRRRSPSPRRRGYSPERRPVRDYDAPPRDSDIKPRY